jgi:hypothetical protein
MPAVSRVVVDTPVSESYELFDVDMLLTTSVVITPTKIKSITSVEVTPTNIAAGADVWYVTYTYGAATCTLNAANSTTFSVKVCGTQA